MNLQKKLVDSLIAAINPKYISLFGTDAIQKYKFIPLKINDDYLFVAITSESDKNFVAKYVQKKLSYYIKYIEISNDDFAHILTHIFNKNT